MGSMHALENVLFKEKYMCSIEILQQKTEKLLDSVIGH